MLVRSGWAQHRTGDHVAWYLGMHCAANRGGLFLRYQTVRQRHVIEIMAKHDYGRPMVDLST